MGWGSWPRYTVVYTTGCALVLDLFLLHLPCIRPWAELNSVSPAVAGFTSVVRLTKLRRSSKVTCDHIGPDSYVIPQQPVHLPKLVFPPCAVCTTPHVPPLQPTVCSSVAQGQERKGRGWSSALSEEEETARGAKEDGCSSLRAMVGQLRF